MKLYKAILGAVMFMAPLAGCVGAEPDGENSVEAPLTEKSDQITAAEDGAMVADYAPCTGAATSGDSEEATDEFGTPVATLATEANPELLETCEHKLSKCAPDEYTCRTSYNCGPGYYTQCVAIPGPCAGGQTYYSVRCCR